MARVLLADDDRGVLESLERLLSLRGHGVVLASSAVEVLEALRGRAVDLLVTDIHMPGNDRLQMLSEHPDLFAQLPIIVITAHPTLDTAVSAVRLPVIDYIVKPIDPVHFLEQIDRALARSRSMPKTTGDSRAASELAGLLPSELAELSPREIELLIQLARGFPPPAIADQLNISHHTVRNHLKSIYQKLKVGSQVELMRVLLVGRGSPERA